MGGHVDDFHRTGDLSNPRWCKIRQEVDKAYAWGTVKKGSYRHAGTDLVSKHSPEFGDYLEVNQDQFVETLQDLDLRPQTGDT